MRYQCRAPGRRCRPRAVRCCGAVVDALPVQAELLADDLDQLASSVQVQAVRCSLPPDYDASAIDRRSPMASSNARRVRNSGLPLSDSVR